MLKLLTLNDAGTSGINTDNSPWNLPPEFITDGQNFRVFANTIYSSAGSENISISGAWYDAGHLRYINTPSGAFWVAPGANGVYVYDGAGWHSIGSGAGNYPSIGTNNATAWTSCLLGVIPLFNNPSYYPEYWAPISTEQKLQPLEYSSGVTFEDAQISFKVLRSHKNYLFGLNRVVSGEVQQDSFMWSAPADANSLPFTWDPLDLSSTAGDASLGGDGGAIIDGLSLRDSFCIYSENSIDILDPTFDDLVWRRRELSTSVGLLSVHCVTEVEGLHYFLTTDGDMMVNNGNSVESIAHNRIRKRLKNSKSNQYFNRSFVVKHLEAREVWFCIPEKNNDYPSTAYIYNWRDRSWAIRELPNNEFTKLAHSDYGFYATPGLTWDDIDYTWDEWSNSWDSDDSGPGEGVLMAINIANSSLVHIDTRLSASEDDLSFIERTDFPIAGNRQVVTAVRAYPHIEGSGTITIQFGYQNTPGGSVTWKPPIDFTPGVDRKVDFRVTGSLLCWNISSVNGVSWSFSGMDIEFEQAGLR